MAAQICGGAAAQDSKAGQGAAAQKATPLRAADER